MAARKGRQMARSLSPCILLLLLLQPCSSLLSQAATTPPPPPPPPATAGVFDVLFLGTGVSTGVPKIGCIVRPDPSMPKCLVCHDAMQISSKNRRGNVSILLRFWHKDGRPRHIMVDAGKTMRENCMRFLPDHGVRSLDCLLLTHSHADAIHGLDDIRDFQEQSGVILRHLPPLPVYLNEATFDEVKRRFRRQSHPSQSPQVAQGHTSPTGETLGCLLFQRWSLKAWQVLVLDALDDKPHFSHFNVQEAMDAAAEISPRKLLLVRECGVRERCDPGSGGDDLLDGRPRGDQPQVQQSSSFEEVQILRSHFLSDPHQMFVRRVCEPAALGGAGL
eukprot:767903-Hanusia_phi.AAC.1